jgi:hypothetical protein
MIIFPLITTGRLRTALTLTPRYFQSECHLNEVEHDPVLFPPLQHEEDFRRSPRRRADSIELNERCLTTSDPVTSFLSPPCAGLRSRRQRT